MVDSEEERTNEGRGSCEWGLFHFILIHLTKQRICAGRCACFFFGLGLKGEQSSIVCFSTRISPRCWVQEEATGYRLIISSSIALWVPSKRGRRYANWVHEMLSSDSSSVNYVSPCQAAVASIFTAQQVALAQAASSAQYHGPEINSLPHPHNHSPYNSQVGIIIKDFLCLSIGLQWRQIMTLGRFRCQLAGKHLRKLVAETNRFETVRAIRNCIKFFDWLRKI